MGRGRGRRAASLIELLIAVVLLAGAVASIVGMFATANRAGGIADRRGRATALAEAAAEVIRSDATGYVECATGPEYAPDGLDVPAGWTVTVVGVEYWTGANPIAFGTECVLDDEEAAGDPGLQRIEIVAAHPATNTSVTVFAHKRRP